MRRVEDMDLKVESNLLNKKEEGNVNINYDEASIEERKIYSSESLKLLLKIALYTSAIFLFLSLTFGFFVFIVPLIQELPFSFQKQTTITVPIEDEQQLAFIKQTNKEIAKLKNKLNAYAPRSSYLVINTTENRFMLYQKQGLVREGKCSTGSYINLVKDDRKAWIFRTPKGMYPIRGKTTSPVWIKPDWAFIEEGMPVPSANHPSRYESGVLGDYALSLGQGYMIHGTLYQRFLGMAVTHGCVRLNDDDLNTIYHTLDIGSKVFIY